MNTSPDETIRAMVAAAPVFAAPDGRPATPQAGDDAGACVAPDSDDDTRQNYDSDEAGPSDAGGGGRDDPPSAAIIAECALLDHSDTDNGRRLIAHFGADLAVLEQEGVRNTAFYHWSGTHWDTIGGDDAAMRTAQRIGARIGLEADYLALTPHEARTVDAAEDAATARKAMGPSRADWKDEHRAKARQLDQVIADGAAALDALSKRKSSRRKFAVSSKNKSRLEAMLSCAAAHLTRKPDAFNADPLKFACLSHTLSFVRRQVADPECPDPDVTRMIEQVVCEALEGHERADLITQVVPVAYDPDARCPRFMAFLERFLPVAAVRDCVQIITGIGLLGIPVQYFAFHYGLGANGKSVFLETITRLLGQMAVGLPAESISGDTQRAGAQASPDLARLFGKRFLRVLELPEGKELHSELVKKLTGGEKIPVRSLFKSFFEFTPVFIAHMSGNGYPKITDASDGIWRRMLVIHWPVQIPIEERRDFEDVLAEFAAEYPGILNWMIDGALRYLRDGFRPPTEVMRATQEYREEMDLTLLFVRDCVAIVPPGPDGKPVATVQARPMYEAFKSYCLANARTPWHESRFGRVLRDRIPREDGRLRQYLNCRLHDVPERPAPPRNPDREEYP